MKKLLQFPVLTVIPVFLILTMLLGLMACDNTSSNKEREMVERQQEQYVIGQPIPAFNWSLERDLIINLYNIRNQRVSTHAVWRSDYGLVEGDCPSMGFGLPYDTSLTNPLMPDFRDSASRIAIEQPEPNGIFASKNTSATWVMCLGESGSVEPVYVESKVTIYPGPVTVDYANNLVTRSGAATVIINTGN